MVNTIYRNPVMAAGEQHVEQTGSIIRWYPYASMDTASEVQIQLTDVAGRDDPRCRRYNGHPRHPPRPTCWHFWLSRAFTH